MIKHLVCVDPFNNHFKDYTAELIGTNVLCKWGRIGQTHQSKEFEFDTIQEAVNFFNKKITEKLQRGYQ